jgi:PAS domain S-box-containing protein
MTDTRKTKAQLVEEMEMLRARVAELEDLETEHRPMEKVLLDYTRRLEALRQVTLDITGQLGQDALLRALAKSVFELLEAKGGSVYLYRPERDVIEGAMSVGPIATEGKVLTCGEGLAGKVWDSGKPLAVDNYSEWEGRAEVFEEHNFTAVLGAPIHWNKELLGVFVAIADSPRKFSQSDTDLLSLFASQSAIAIQNARLYEQEQQRVTELDALRRVSLEIAAQLELPEVFRAIAEGILKLLPDVMDAHLFLHEEGQLVFGTAVGRDGFMSKPFAEPRPNGITHEVARQGKSIVISDMTVHPLYRDIAGKSASTGAITSFPLKVGGHVVGVMNVAYSHPREFSKDELRTLELLADHAAIAINNAQLHDQAQQEITKREQAEEALRESEERYRALTENSPVGVFVSDAEQFIYVNQKLCEIVGFTSVELLEMSDPVGSLFAPGEKERVLAYATSRLAGSPTQTGYEARGIRKDGEEIWLKLTVDTVVLSGRTVLQGIIEDITDRKRSEEALRESEERLRALVSALPDVVFIHDRDGSYLDVLTGQEDLLVAEAEQQKGGKVHDSLPKEQADLILEAVQRTLEKQEPQVTEYVLEVRAGRRWFEARTAPLQLHEDGTQGVVRISHDITDRRRHQEALQQHTDQLEALRRVTLDITSTLELDTLLEKLTKSAFSLVNATTGGTYLYRPERDVLEWVVSVGEGHVPLGTELSRGEGLSGKVWESRKPLAVSNYSEWEGRSAAFDKYAFKAILGVPILYSDEFLGVISAVSDTPDRTFSDDDTRLLSVFADQAAIAIHNVRLYEKLREGEEKYRGLFENANDAIYLIDPETTQILDCNPKAAEMDGYSIEELRQMTIVDLHPETEHDELPEKFEAVSREGSATGISGLHHVHKDGRLVPIEVSATMVEIGGRLLNVSIVRDITERERAEEALRESEERLRNIVDSIPLGMHMYELDSEDRLIFIGANSAANKILGVDHEQFLGKRSSEAFPASAGTEIPDRYRAAASKGETWHVEQVAYEDEQVSGAFEVHAFQTSPGRMVAAFQDITERKRAEEALRESHANFTALMENTDDFILICDEQALPVLFNRAYAQIMAEALGIEMKPGLQPHKLLPDPEQVAWWDNIHRRVLEGEKFRVEYAYLFDEQDIRHFEFSYRPLLVDGEVRGFSEVSRDITERKQAAEALRASEQKYRSLFENMHSGFAYHQILTDEDGRPVDYRFIEINDAFEAQTGLERDTVVDKRVKEFLPDIEKAKFDWIGTYGKVALTGEPAHFEHYYDDPLNRWYSVAAYSPAQDHFATIFSDITDAKRAEEALRRAAKLESLGVLAGGVAHDFNNLLTTMRLEASMAKSKLPEDHASRKHLDHAIGAMKRASDLAGQMLAYSGRGHFQIGEVNLNQLVEESSDLLRSSITSAVRLELDLAPDLPQIKADPTQMEQVLMNLVINAAEACEDAGTVKVSTHVETIEDDHQVGFAADEPLPPGRYVCLKVTDDGSGLDEGTAGQLFDPFYSTKATGRGLGLSVVLGIVRGHQGDIRVASQVGKGSEFCAMLPALESDKPQGG